MTLDARTIAQLMGGEASGDSALVPGPGHPPRDRSLSIKVDARAADGFIVHSFAGDDAIRCRDYVRERTGQEHWRPGEKKKTFNGRTAQTKKANLNFDQAKPQTNGQHEQPQSSRKVCEYVYKLADGTPYLRVDRYEPKSFPQYHWTGNAWASGKPDGPKIPYRLPEMLKAVHDTVFICEGEKDADRLGALGFVATTASEGAGKWKEDINPHFVGKDVFILADNDDAGRKHAHDVARHLNNIASEVRVVELPGLPEKGDVSDWLDAGGEAASLSDTCKVVPLWTPEQAPSEDQRNDPGARIEIIRADAIEQRPVSWIWEGRIARGKQTLIGGDPGLGKSQIAINAVSHTTKGTAWPDGGIPPKGNCIILSAEDAANDTLCPRLAVAGADLTKVHILQAVTEGNGRKRSFSLQRDLEALGATIKEIGGATLIVIDPITAYMGDVDSHRTTDVRAVLEPLDKFAEAHNVAVIAITHPPKGSTGKAIHSFTGSLAFVAAARLAFVVTEEPETGRSLLLPVKNNLGPRAGGIGYRIESVWTAKGISTARIAWNSEPVTMTANEAVKGSSEEFRGADRRKAKEWLAGYLESGPMLADDVKNAADRQSLNPRTLRRAREELEVIVEKESVFQGKWFWRLP